MIQFLLFMYTHTHTNTAYKRLWLFIYRLTLIFSFCWFSMRLFHMRMNRTVRSLYGQGARWPFTSFKLTVQTIFFSFIYTRMTTTKTQYYVRRTNRQHFKWIICRNFSWIARQYSIINATIFFIFIQIIKSFCWFHSSWIPLAFSLDF